MKNLEKFIELDDKKLESEMKEEVITRMGNALTRKKMDLQEAVMGAERHLRKVSRITNLTSFTPENWLASIQEATDNLDLAKARLKRFEELFDGE